MKADGVMVLEGPQGAMKIGLLRKGERDMHPLSVLPTGVRHLKQCPGKTLLPTAAGSAVKGYVGSWILPCSS